MTEELIAFHAAKEVAVTVSSIVIAFREHRTVGFEQRILLKERINTLRVCAHAKGLGELAVVNIEEICKVQKFIDDMNLSGPSLEMAMKQLKALSDQLTRNLERFI